MYEYIIYSRLTNPHPFFEKKADYAKAYLEDRIYKKDIGHKLGTKMAQDLAEALETAEGAKKYKERSEAFDKTCEILYKHGVRLYNWDKDKFYESLEEHLSGHLSANELWRIESDAKAILKEIDRIKEIKNIMKKS